MVNICVFYRGKLFENEKSFCSIPFDELILCDKCYSWEFVALYSMLTRGM